MLQSLLRTSPKRVKKWQVHSAALRSLLLTQGRIPRGRFLLRLVACLDHAVAPPECIVRQTRDMRERYCCWRLNTLYCPHCGHWLPQHDGRGIRLWTNGQWVDLSPVARGGVTVGCKPCAAANEQEEARELLRQQPRGGEACSRMDHD